MFSNVQDFHQDFGHPIGRKPRLLAEDRMKTRQKWTREELDEIDKAMWEQDIIGVSDGIADAIYFLLGTAVEMGIPFDEIWQHVHTANMRKKWLVAHTSVCETITSDQEHQRFCTCGVVRYSPERKVLKPENWHPPEGAIRTSITVACYDE